MKKIGVLAFFHPQTRNYGAVLQAYALSKTVQQLGYDVELIDIRDKTTIKFSTLLKNKIRRCIEGNPFRTFLKSQVSLSKPLLSFAELNEHANEYYAVIVGSDQVWRPEYCGNMALHYFLDFVPQSVLRVAYAVSFGVDNWTVDQDITEIIRKEVHKFKAVSVRELAGVDICKEVFGIKASHALDPTLLVDKKLFYDLLPQHKIKQEVKKQYIVSFVLDRTEETDAIESYISKQSGKSIHSINKRKICFFGRKWEKFLSIKGWLTQLRDSEMIITDSFHCVCFSLIFQKNFICIGNKSRGLSRLNSLLKVVGLEDRIFLNFTELENSSFWDTDIDYKRVNDSLEFQRMISLGLLKDSLVK